MIIRILGPGPAIVNGRPLLKLVVEKVSVFVWVVAAILTETAVGHAQPGGRTHLIGYLSNSTAEVSVELEEGLRHLGYVRGRNLRIEARSSHGDHRKLPGLARELVELGCEVIIANSSTSAIAARQMTTMIPIVFLVSADPVGSGLVQSLSWPGTNVTGPSAMSVDFVPKRLELLREVRPRLARLAVLSNPGQPVSVQTWRWIGRSAPSLGITAKQYEVRNPAEVKEAFKAMTTDRIEGVLVVNDPLLVGLRAELAQLLASHRLPAVLFVDPPLHPSAADEHVHRLRNRRQAHRLIPRQLAHRAGTGGDPHQAAHLRRRQRLRRPPHIGGDRPHHQHDDLQQRACGVACRGRLHATSSRGPMP